MRGGFRARLDRVVATGRVKIVPENAYFGALSQCLPNHATKSYRVILAWNFWTLRHTRAGREAAEERDSSCEHRVNLLKEVPTLKSPDRLSRKSGIKTGSLRVVFGPNVLRWIFSESLTVRRRGTTLGKIASCLGKYRVRAARRPRGS